MHWGKRKGKKQTEISQIEAHLPLNKQKAFWQKIEDLSLLSCMRKDQWKPTLSISVCALFQP